MKKLKDLFEEKEKFLIGTELVTTRGAIQQKEGKKVVDLAKELLQRSTNRLDIFSPKTPEATQC